MDRKSMMEKFIEHEKSAFNSLVGSMSAIQDQAEESLSFFLQGYIQVPIKLLKSWCVMLTMLLLTKLLFFFLQI